MAFKESHFGLFKNIITNYLARTYRIDAKWIQSFDIETCQPTKLLNIVLRIIDKQNGIDPDTIPIATYLYQKLKRKFIPSTYEEALEMCNDITEAGEYLVGRTESKSDWIAAIKSFIKDIPSGNFSFTREQKDMQKTNFFSHMTSNTDPTSGYYDEVDSTFKLAQRALSYAHLITTTITMSQTLGYNPQSHQTTTQSHRSQPYKGQSSKPHYQQKQSGKPTTYPAQSTQTKTIQPHTKLQV
jgi:hypothetical protein